MEAPKPPIQLYRESQMGVCLDQALRELAERHGLSPELHEDTMAQFDHDIIEQLEKQSGPSALVRGRIVTFKHYLSSWTFNLQPAYVTWDRPSNINSWVRFERLRLVLEDKSKVDEQRKAVRPVAQVPPPPSPPPPSPPPSPPPPPPPGIGDESDSDDGDLAPRAPVAAAAAAYPAIGDESESDGGGQPLRAAVVAAHAYLGIGDESDSDDRRPAARRLPAVGDEADDSDDGPQPPAPLLGQKRPREAGAGAADADHASELDEPALPGAVGELLPDDDDDELGSDDDDDDEEVDAMLDETTFADAPCMLAQYSKPVHKKDSYKFDLQLGVLSEGSRVHVFREGKVELDFVDASTFAAKLRQLRMLE